MTGFDTREWRVHPVASNSVVAVNPGEEPGGADLVAMCLTPEQAQQIVAEHAAAKAET